MISRRVTKVCGSPNPCRITFRVSSCDLHQCRLTRFSGSLATDNFFPHTTLRFNAKCFSRGNRALPGWVTTDRFRLSPECGFSTNCLECSSYDFAAVLHAIHGLRAILGHLNSFSPQELPWKCSERSALCKALLKKKNKKHWRSVFFYHIVRVWNAESIVFPLTFKSCKDYFVQHIS